MKRYRVVPCDNDGTLADSDGNPPPRDRTWDVVDENGTVVSANNYTRREARDECARCLHGVMRVHGIRNALGRP